MASDSMNRPKSGTAVVPASAGAQKPHSIIDAISEIQQYYLVEKSGSTISSDFLTVKGKLGFFEVGVKSGVISGVITTLLAPVAIGVFERYIPVFGSYEPSIFDQAFALLLAVSFSIGYAGFVSVVGKFYIGDLTRATIRSLLGGLTAGSLFKLFLAFLLFHLMYLKLDSTMIAKLLLFFDFAISYDHMLVAHDWWLGFRPAFLTAAWVVVATTALFIVIPIASVAIQSRKTRRLMEWENEWK